MTIEDTTLAKELKSLALRMEKIGCAYDAHIVYRIACSLPHSDPKSSTDQDTASVYIKSDS